MGEKSASNREHLYNNTITSLQKYHLSVTSLVGAVKKIKNKDNHFEVTIHSYLNRLKRSILEIQTIQQKKIDVNQENKPFNNMVSYKINLQNETPKIMVEEDKPLPPWIQNL